MSSAFKNRLVGTLVFIALLVIFLPDLLDGKKQAHQDNFQEIPKKDLINIDRQPDSFPQAKHDELMQEDVEEFGIEEIVDLDDGELVPSDIVINDNPDVVDVAVIEKEQPIDEDVLINKPKKPPVINNPTPADESQSRYSKPAWVVQLGSFKYKKNVNSLVSKLKREGYLVFTKPANNNLTKVFIGPDLNKNKLDAMIPELKKLTNLSGKLAIYDANKP